MSIVEEVELLRRIPLFAKIDPARLKLLAFTSDRVTFEAGQKLFEQGEGGDSAAERRRVPPLRRDSG